ncbi:FAD-dependent oxidoreductase [Natronomonas sp. LN261]|uniref:FAD-dependent oxidoreductase n=1 Tax=Natronomonas sp. LN261 TaxID=2750669 RepID=UPI0015EE72CC|nr:FAD-dependent oxidoreductase [Natronomonas sp. LN261]
MQYTIIGGGVQGLSTGILLQYIGHDTKIVSDTFAYVDGSDTPTVATNYAAASVYPVQIESAYSEDELIELAESTFEPFYQTDGIPVRKHTHYYLYEEPRAEPIPARMEVQDIAAYEGNAPSRPGRRVRDGYACKEYFVEMPEYVPLLYAAYEALGGETERRTLAAGEVDELPGEAVFNCSGYGSRVLFGDDSMTAIKGHILEVPYDGDAPLPFSYTYTPAEYGHYVYMYPRKESVLFGGSYLRGDIVDGEWRGETPETPTTIDGETIPERLYTVNEAITSEYVDVNRADVSVKYGYRPYRAAGMRVEAEGDIVHNYGHGGSGVSMSWWSALEAVGYVDDVSESLLADVAETIARTPKT